MFHPRATDGRCWMPSQMARHRARSNCAASRGRDSDRPHRCGFTLVELLVVIGVIALLIAVLMPALTKARAASVRTHCLSNIRQLQIAQTAYAASERNALVFAGDGTEQGSWIGLLQKYAGNGLVRRCPADQSPYFDSPLPGSSTANPKFRTTSYAINNYVSPSHFPFSAGRKPPKRITQIPRSSRVIQFGELAEINPDATTNIAGGDHLHIDQFYLSIAPQITILRINDQMPLGRHGGRIKSFDAILNFGFLDGHAESLPIRLVYTNPSRNLFDPLVAN